MKRISFLLSIFCCFVCVSSGSCKDDDYQCWWMQSNGKFTPANDLFSSEITKAECQRLDSCYSGAGGSGGGCYKWTTSADALFDGWTIEIETDGGTIILHSIDKRESCPGDSRLITFEEATTFQDQICRNLAGSWQIMSIADGGSMDGGEYGNSCEIRRSDNRNLGHMLCIIPNAF